MKRTEWIFSDWFHVGRAERRELITEIFSKRCSMDDNRA